MNKISFLFVFMLFFCVVGAGAFQVQSSQKNNRPSASRAPGVASGVKTEPVTTRTMSTYGSGKSWSRSAAVSKPAQSGAPAAATPGALPKGDYGMMESPDLVLPGKTTQPKAALTGKSAAAVPSNGGSLSSVSAAAASKAAPAPAAGDMPQMPAESAAALKQAQDMAKQMGIDLPDMSGMSGLPGEGGASSGPVAGPVGPAAAKNQKMFGNFSDLGKKK